MPNVGPERAGRILPDQFWREFSAQLSRALSESGEWPAIYKDPKPWTKFVDSTCRRTGEKLGFRTERENAGEYMKVDRGFFSIGPEESDKRWCNWDWEVAIEYENSPTGNDWVEEVTRLAHLNAGLKVLVTYTAFSTAGSDPCLALIDAAAKLCAQRKYRQSDERWLFIIGPRYPDLATQPAVDFRAFAWSPGADPVELAGNTLRSLSVVGC